MSRISEEQSLKNTETVEKLIETLPGGDGLAGLGRRERVKAMFADVGLEYFTAPASSREDYHGCYPGGLCDHSLRVAKNLVVLAESLAPGKYPREQLIFLGLMHDLGKVGDPPVSLYVPNPSEWHRKKGMLFEINKELTFMPVCDRTMYLLQKFGVSLDAEEYVALRISDGPYEKCNERYAMKEPDLAVLLHMADRWACAQEKRLG